MKIRHAAWFILLSCLVARILPASDCLAADTQPKLVVVVIVDQLGAEVFERLAPLYKGGLKIFYRSGIRFTNAHHDHALTQTAPGHFALFSGRHPGPGGVPANEYYDRTRRRIVYSVEDPDARVIGSRIRGVSWRTLAGTALGDWMKAANAESKVYALAGKDRAAVLMGGRRPDGVFWFDRDVGGFTTSSFYADTLPRVVERFSAAKPVDRHFGKSWERLLRDEKIYLKYAGPDDAPEENVMNESEETPVFPHLLPTPYAGRSPGREDYGKFAAFPWMDALTLELAKKILTTEQLGKDGAPDLLAVSLSAFDVIGHTFGPHSQEAMDAALRIDRALGEFITAVDSEVGRGNAVFVLSADHGVLPLPAWSKSHGRESVRVHGEVKKFKNRLFDAFEKSFPDAGSLFLFRGQENIHFNHDSVAQRKLAPAELYSFVRAQAATETWIAHVFDRQQLMTDVPLGPVGDRMRHSFNVEAGADLYFIPKPYYLTAGSGGGRGTSHGTPYEYDSNVPLIFVSPGMKTKVVERSVRTVDLAPTLADLLGIAFPADLDGRPLEEIRSKN